MNKLKFLILVTTTLISVNHGSISYTEEQKEEMRLANSIFEKTVGEWCASNIYFVNNTGNNVIVRYNDCEHPVEKEKAHEFKGSPCISFDVLEKHEDEECYGLLHIDTASPDGAQYIVTFDPYRTKEEMIVIQRKNECFLKKLLPSRAQSISFLNNTGKVCVLRVNSGCEYRIGIEEKARYEFPHRNEFYNAFELVEGEGILHIDKVYPDGTKHIITLDKERDPEEISAIQERSRVFNDQLFSRLGVKSLRFINNTEDRCVIRINGECEYIAEKYKELEFFNNLVYQTIELAEGNGTFHLDNFSVNRTSYYLTLDSLPLSGFSGYLKGSPELTWNEAFDAHLKDWTSRQIYFVNNTKALCAIKVNDRCEFRVGAGYTCNLPKRYPIYSSLKLLYGQGVLHIDTTSPDGGSHIITLDPYRTLEEISEIQRKNKDFRDRFHSRNVSAFRFKNNTKKWCIIRVNEGCEYKIGLSGEYEFPYKNGIHHSLELISGDGIFHMDQTSVGGNTHIVTLDPDRSVTSKKMSAEEIIRDLIK